MLHDFLGIVRNATIPFEEFSLSGALWLTVFVIVAVVALGLLERAYVGFVVRRNAGAVRSRMDEKTARSVAGRLTWRFVVATYLLLFLFVALGRRIIAGQMSPAGEVTLYGLLSAPLIIAFMIYTTNRTE